MKGPCFCFFYFVRNNSCAKYTFLNQFVLITSAYCYFYPVVTISISFLYVHCPFIFSVYSVAFLFLLILFSPCIFFVMYFTFTVYVSLFPLNFPLYYNNFVYTAFFLPWSLSFKPFSLQLPFCCHFFVQSINHSTQHILSPSIIHLVTGPEIN